MATAAAGMPSEANSDKLLGTPRAHALDRWIFVLMATWFIAITLIGFIPDSLMKMELVRAGARPPFPIVLHMHAVLMGSFLLFLLSQTVLVATGRCGLHRKVGPVGAILAVALVIVGFVLAPTMYGQVWTAANLGPPDVAERMAPVVPMLDNILLMQLGIGVMFPILLFIGLKARDRNSGFHKRMMMLAPATALPAAIDRITWIPHTIPANPASAQLYVLLALAPMLVWDLIRNGRVHRAYWTFAAIYLPVCIIQQLAWDTAWWHATAPRLMGS